MHNISEQLTVYIKLDSIYKMEYEISAQIQLDIFIQKSTPVIMYLYALKIN